MIVLGLDTCLDACSAAVVDGERVLASRSEPMARGHQERLATLTAEVLADAGLSFDRLDRIGVTVGPGSFTGLRVGIAFAKGLSAALSRPLVGVGVLEALAASTPRGRVAAAVDARRGQVYFQMFDDGAAVGPPEVLTTTVAQARCAGGASVLGSGARLLTTQPAACTAPDPADVARLAAARPPGPLRPLYLRAPDAKAPGG